jgi:hypothetical protein
MPALPRSPRRWAARLSRRSKSFPRSRRPAKARQRKRPGPDRLFLEYDGTPERFQHAVARHAPATHPPPPPGCWHPPSPSRSTAEHPAGSAPERPPGGARCTGVLPPAPIPGYRSLVTACGKSERSWQLGDDGVVWWESPRQSCALPPNESAKLATGRGASQSLSTEDHFTSAFGST